MTPTERLAVRTIRFRAGGRLHDQALAWCRHCNWQEIAVTVASAALAAERHRRAHEAAAQGEAQAMTGPVHAATVACQLLPPAARARRAAPSVGGGAATPVPAPERTASYTSPASASNNAPLSDAPRGPS